MFQRNNQPRSRSVAARTAGDAPTTTGTVARKFHLARMVGGAALVALASGVTLPSLAPTPASAAATPPKPAPSQPAPPSKPAAGKADPLAVLEASCIKCHGGRDTKGGLDLTNREGLLNGSDSGPTVVPGKPADSLLIQTVKHEADPHMPPKGPKLSDEAIATLADWIKAGVPYARKMNKAGADAGGGGKGGPGAGDSGAGKKGK